APIRKSRLPRPSHRGMRAAVCCKARSACASQGGAACTVSSPIQASKMSPGKSRAAASSAADSRKPRKASAVAGVAGPRCTSEASHIGPCNTTLFNDFGLFDDHVFGGNVLVKTAVARFHALDLVDHVRAFGDFAEYGIAPAVGRGRSEVQEVVVGDVDKELGRSRVRVAGARHGQRVFFVLQAVVGFVLDGSLGGFLLQARLEAAALDHEAID